MICKGKCGEEVADVDAIDSYCIFCYDGIIDFSYVSGGV
jgi:hypothetical protein